MIIRNSRPRKRHRAWCEDDSLELPSFEVLVDEYDPEFTEDTGLLGPDGQPILRRVIPPKRQPAGFIWFANEDEYSDDDENDG